VSAVEKEPSIMSEAQASNAQPVFGQEDAASFSDKLVAFVGGLTPGEQAVFQEILREPDRAADVETDVHGHSFGIGILNPFNPTTSPTTVWLVTGRGPRIQGAYNETPWRGTTARDHRNR
jgi:hypothetical protein